MTFTELKTADGRPIAATVIVDFLKSLKAYLENPQNEFEVPTDFAHISDSDANALVAELLKEGLTNRSKPELIWATGFFGDDSTSHSLADRLVNLKQTDELAWIVAPTMKALAQIGSRGALMEVQRLAVFAKSSSVISAANDTLRSVADERAVRVWKIEDDIVPDCGLDSFGGFQFDDGVRQLHFNLSPLLKPFLQDTKTHERFDDFPESPSATDHGKSAADWAVLQKQLSDAIPVQIHRLEQSLALQYRWDIAQFKKAFLTHPLLIHLSQRILWGRFKTSGRIIDSFRVTADRTLAGPDDEPYALDDEGCIGILHPDELDASALDMWGRQLADYEVVTLFPQLDRARFPLEPENKKDIQVPVKYLFPYEPFYASLYRRGWTLDENSWGRIRLSKAYRFHDIKASLTIENSDDKKTTRVDALSFHRFLGYPETDFQLRDLPGVVYSESLYDLDVLVSEVPQLER